MSYVYSKEHLINKMKQFSFLDNPKMRLILSIFKHPGRIVFSYRTWQHVNSVGSEWNPWETQKYTEWQKQSLETPFKRYFSFIHGHYLHAGFPCYTM